MWIRPCAVFAAVAQSLLNIVLLVCPRCARPYPLTTLCCGQILNVSAQVPNYFEDSFLYCKIPLVDIETETVRPHLRRAFEFLNDALKVLVVWRTFSK